MANKSIKLAKNDILFREGDSSESMYLIKSGRIAIIRSNAAKDKEVILSEKVHGELLGEMAFFDGLARSAGAKAMVPSEVIELPFKALQDQFQLSPSWLKVMVKTMVTQLRKANVRIRNLENITSDAYDIVAPHTLLNVITIMHLLSYKSAKNSEGLPVFDYKELYFYVRQVFDQEGQKLKRIVAALQELKILSVTGEPTSESQKVTLIEHSTLCDFIEWFTAHIGLSDAERVTLEPSESMVLDILAHFSRELPPDKLGQVRLNLLPVEEKSKDELHLPFKATDIDGLVRKGLMKPRFMVDDITYTSFNLSEIQRLSKFWRIISAVNKTSS
jgi:CRP-like cAMP-binding protein